ncbi:hypothetical protein VE03_07667 [Pseudogymnoascus sp. 23342-1-I1]|nr:hypothetical protein VE03_07667 [Pseudogymnoascus sp. 23342-1-I1]
MLVAFAAADFARSESIAPEWTASIVGLGGGEPEEPNVDDSLGSADFAAAFANISQIHGVDFVDLLMTFAGLASGLVFANPQLGLQRPFRYRWLSRWRGPRDL